MGTTERHIAPALRIPAKAFLDTEGKMLRPLLGYLLLEAFGTEPAPFRTYLILPEILHSASLVIDDIEDSAPLRRNKPTMHQSWGIDTAINTANAFYYFPFFLVEQSKLSSDKKRRICEILIEAMNRIHLGQGLDIYWHRNAKIEVTQEEYLQMTRLKTSSFFRAEAQLAASLSNVNRRSAAGAARFAESLGAGFQIMDDILDITREKDKSKQFGKAFAQDITEGKKTLLVIYTLRRAEKKDKKRLQKILSLHTSNKKFIEEVLSMFAKYDTIEETKKFVERLIKKTWRDFAQYIKPSRAKDYLYSYCEFVLRRKL